MKRADEIWKLSVALIVILAAPLGLARADDEAGTVKKMYEFAKPSLVAVKYTWENELGSQELSAAGVIVREDGLVAFSIEIMPPALVPNDQIKRFKIIVPSDTQDETEIDGTFQGRDERSDLAFVKPENPVKWQAIKFVGETPVVGDRLYSVGMLPKSAGYKSWVTTATDGDGFARAGAADFGFGGIGGDWRRCAGWGGTGDRAGASAGTGGCAVG